MSRPVQQKCLDCSQLTQGEAIALHGPETKTGCWKAKTCPRRRSHYRHRLGNNAKQRGEYRAGKTAGQAVEVREAIFGSDMEVVMKLKPLPERHYSYE